MPLDDTWWDPAGPFADNAIGGITAETMREFAQAIGEQGVTGSWFNVMFDISGITAGDWTTVGAAKVLWLKKTVDFDHSRDREFTSGVTFGDAFTYLQPNVISAQLTFSPSIVHVDGATSGTTIAPVVSMTLDAVATVAAGDIHVVGPSQPITTASQDIDLAGWAAVTMAGPERCLRFGLKFTPPSGFAVSAGSFDVDPTGVGASVVARPLAPAEV